MPDRIVRAAILTSDGVCSLSWAAEVFYRRLMSVVDDYGRYDGRVSVLKSHCYPLQTDKVSERDVGKWLSESAAAGLVTLYSVGTKPYLQVERFNQRIRSDSKWPAPEITKQPENIGSRSIDSKVLTDDSTPPTSAAVFVCVDVCEDVVVGVGVDDTPLPPKGDGVKIDGHGMSIPESLRTGPFREMWTRWCDERRDRKQKQTRRGWETQLVKLARFGPDVAAQAIEQSIANGWQGLFPEKIANGNANGTTNAFGNAGGNRGPVEPNRVRTTTLLDQVDRERERAESAGGSAAGGGGEMQSSGPSDAQAGF